MLTNPSESLSKKVKASLYSAIYSSVSYSDIYNLNFIIKMFYIKLKTLFFIIIKFLNKYKNNIIIK
jgi:hypothetical protein